MTLAALPKGATVQMEGAEATLSLTCGRSRATMPGLPEAQFPAALDTSGGAEIDGAAPALAAFAERDPGRAEFLRGVTLSESRAIATDGSIIAAMPIDAKGVSAGIPREMLSAASAELKDGGRLFVVDRAWRVEGEGFRLSGKLLGQPPHAEILRVASPAPRIGEADADDMRSAAALATVGGAREILLRAEEGEMTLEGRRFDTPSAATSSSLRYDGGAWACVLSAGYVHAALRLLSGSVVEIGADHGTMSLTAGDTTARIFAIRSHENDLPQPSIEDAA